MKSTLLFSLFLFLVLSANAGIIAVPVTGAGPGTSAESNGQWYNNITVKTFLSLTPSRIAEVHGKTLSFREKISLKWAQTSLRKQLKKGAVGEHELVTEKRLYGNNNWGTFFLCLLLGPIGLIIVYLSYYDDPKVARRSAWSGFSVWLLILTIIARLSSMTYY